MMTRIREYEAERRGHKSEIKCNVIPWANIGNDTAMVKLRRMKPTDINSQTPPLFSIGAGASTSDPGVNHKPRSYPGQEIEVAPQKTEVHREEPEGGTEDRRRRSEAKIPNRKIYT